MTPLRPPLSQPSGYALADQAARLSRPAKLPNPALVRKFPPRHRDSFCLDCGTRDCEHLRQARVLTRQQQRLLLFLLEGLRVKDLAARMELSEGTVKIYLTRVYATLGLTGNQMVQAALWAREHRDQLQA